MYSSEIMPPKTKVQTPLVWDAELFNSVLQTIWEEDMKNIPTENTRGI